MHTFTLGSLCLTHLTQTLIVYYKKCPQNGFFFIILLNKMVARTNFPEVMEAAASEVQNIPKVK